MNSTPMPAYHFEGDIVVTGDQWFVRQYLSFPFEVPAGVGELRLRLSFFPGKVGGISNLITLGLFDPQGFRGNAHRNPPDKEVVVGRKSATDGFLSGEIVPGKWEALLAAHAILVDVKPCHYTLDIDLVPQTDMEPVEVRSVPKPRVVGKGPGWFRGDLHTHTRHSDGKSGLPELAAAARARDYDFLVITDHNTTSGLYQLEGAAPDGMLLIPGIELTTYYGHALALGVDRWIDWRTGYEGWTIEDAARSTRENGGLFIMAHPKDIASPVCTGCRWEYSDFPMELVDAIEIWNGYWLGYDDKNPKNLAFWRSLQEEGWRIPLTGGSDLHSLKEWEKDLYPVTCVYANELSTQAILEGIRKGKVVVTSGPGLDFHLTSPDRSEICGIGDTLAAQSPQVCLTGRWENVPPGASLVGRGIQGVVFTDPVAGSGSVDHWVDRKGNSRFWLELYREDGALLAITNPVFLARV